MKKVVEDIPNTIEKLLNCYEDDFNKHEKNLGRDYYKSKKVVSLVKTKDHYRAKVSGHEKNMYHVDINVHLEEGYVDYTCDCPCDFSCKHIYAVMLALKDKNYKVVELKEETKEKKLTVLEMIEKIPPEELKEYIVGDLGKEAVAFDRERLEQYFSKYLPRQSYTYYYNNLHNTLVLDGHTPGLLDKYLKKIQCALSKSDYIEAYYVCKAIIEATKDTSNLNNWQELINSFPLLAMYLRIIYRKSDEELKTTIDIWMKILKKRNYYDCVYLEDIVLELI